MPTGPASVLPSVLSPSLRRSPEPGPPGPSPPSPDRRSGEREGPGGRTVPEGAGALPCWLQERLREPFGRTRFQVQGQVRVDQFDLQYKRLTT
jgi:hypothetical protein